MRGTVTFVRASQMPPAGDPPMDPPHMPSDPLPDLPGAPDLPESSSGIGFGR